MARKEDGVLSTEIMHLSQKTFILINNNELYGIHE